MEEFLISVKNWIPAITSVILAANVMYQIFISFENRKMKWGDITLFVIIAIFIIGMPIYLQVINPDALAKTAPVYVLANLALAWLFQSKRLLKTTDRKLHIYSIVTFWLGIVAGLFTMFIWLIIEKFSITSFIYLFVIAAYAIYVALSARKKKNIDTMK